MFCTHCGGENPTQASYCLACGSPLLPVADNVPQWIGVSAMSRGVEAEIDSAARSNAKVLITGESGVGKEVVAHLIHHRSQRGRSSGRSVDGFGRPRQAGVVTINCTSLTEPELFGHADKPGKLQLAHGGTVFLDEIGELSLRMQALLLRFLETGQIQHADTPSVKVDVRIITATSRDLAVAVAAHHFREDLYIRLNVLHLHIPPLRERREDIQALAEHYLDVFANQHRTVTPTLSKSALEMLAAYPWPGNVRELKNVVERLVLHVTTSTIESADVKQEIMTAASPVPADWGRPSMSHEQRVAIALERLLNQRESFWTAVYPLFHVP